MKPSELCDTCRQNRAIQRWTDATVPGQLVDRQLCAACIELSEEQIMFQLSEFLLLGGKCQYCGGPVFAISGVPGPNRVVACQRCEVKRLETT